MLQKTANLCTYYRLSDVLYIDSGMLVLGLGLALRTINVGLGLGTLGLGLGLRTYGLGLGT